MSEQERDRAARERGQPIGHDDELVDEAAEESFPASDPPSWQPMKSSAPDERKDEHPDVPHGP